MRSDAVVSGVRVPPSRAVAVSVLLVVSAALSILAFHYRLRALGFHWRDFGFFVDRYHHLLDVPAWRHTPVNPNGNDAFGFHGIDGYPTVHHEVHASAIEYPLALLYAATGSLYAVAAALLAGYLAALAYVHRRATAIDRSPLLHFSMLALLVLSPPFVFGTTFDLRPFAALGPFLLALAVALLSRAPGWHLAIITALGLAAREDAALIAALACVHLHLSGREREATWLYSSAAAYALGFHAVYAGWMALEHEWSVDSIGALLIFCLYPAVAALPPRAASRVSAAFAPHHASSVLLLALPFLAMMARQVLVVGWPRHSFVWTPRWYGPTAVVLVVGASWAAARASDRALRLVAGAVAILALAGGIASVRQIAKWQREAEERAPLWAIRDAISDDTPVVTDYRLYQLFASRGGVLVWDRFPAYLEPTPGRDHPESHPRLRAAVLEHDALVVMRPSDYQRFAETMRDTGEQRRWTTCAEGRDWVVLRPEPSSLACPRVR